jgi:putative methyltransferase (TIGR04325 family)
MGLISVTYELQESFAAARALVGPNAEHGALTDPPPAAWTSKGRQPLKLPVASGPTYLGHSIAALAIVAIHCHPRRARVLDIGGASGAHFFMARDCFDHRVQFDWTVLELPNYVEYGRRHLSETDGLRFVERLEGASEEIDIAYLSGILQFSGALDDFLSARHLNNAPFVFISRSAMAESEVPFVQTVTYDDRINRYAGRVFSKKDLFDHMTRHGYELFAFWQHEYYCVGEVREAPSMLWRRCGF